MNKKGLMGKLGILCLGGFCLLIVGIIQFFLGEDSTPLFTGALILLFMALSESTVLTGGKIK